jgi:hypothetical protein
MQTIKKPTCVGFFIKLVRLITLQRQQEQQPVRKQQEQQLVRKQLQQQVQEQQQERRQEQQPYHKRTGTEPAKQQRSERRISFCFLQLFKKLREC